MKLLDLIGRQPVMIGFGHRGPGVASLDVAAGTTGVSIGPGLDLPLVTTGTAGLLSPDDKTRLDALQNTLVTTDTVTFQSRAQVSTISISDPQALYLRTEGYNAAGDGGGALYLRATSEPSHAGKVQSADGTWWEMVRDQSVALEAFGGFPSGADCAGAINDYIDFHDNRMTTSANTRSTSGAFPIQFADLQGTYVIASKITIPANKNCYFYSPIPGGIRLQYTGPDTTMVVFEPKSSGASFGAIGMVFEGGSIAVIGAVNGQAIFKDCIFSHADRGLWFCDSFQYYDDDNPAYAITGVVADMPLRMTIPGHGFSDGDRVGLIECEGEERLNTEYDYNGLDGRLYARVIDLSTVEFYEDAAFTQGYDASGYTTSNFTGGKATLGHTLRPIGASDRNTVHFDIERCSFISCGHGLLFESSTYALFTARKLRFNFCRLTPLIIDGSGLSFDEMEFLGVEDPVNSAYIQVRCRHNPASEIALKSVRTGPEETTVTTQYYAQETVFPPHRLVIIGPHDGTPAKKTAARIQLNTCAFYGDNKTVKETAYAVDVNAQMNDSLFEAIVFRNIVTAIFKETAAEAGRNTGRHNVIGATCSLEITDPTWLTADGDGWINLAAETMPARGGQPTIVADPVGIDTAGGGTIAPLANADNENLMQLSVTTGAAPSGSSVATITLPRPRPQQVRVFIQAANQNAISEAFYPTTPTTNSFTLRTASTLEPNTNYKMNVYIHSIA